MNYPNNNSLITHWKADTYYKFGFTDPHLSHCFKMYVFLCTRMAFSCVVSASGKKTRILNCNMVMLNDTENDCTKPNFMIVLKITYLLVSFEVNLLNRLVEPLRVCESGVASWDKLGDAGGPLYVAVRRSLSWPWKVLRLAVPLGKRMRSGVVALLMLWVEATGVLWSGIALEQS